MRRGAEYFEAELDEGDEILVELLDLKAQQNMKLGELAIDRFFKFQITLFDRIHKWMNLVKYFHQTLFLFMYQNEPQVIASMKKMMAKNGISELVSCHGTSTFIPHNPVMTFKGTRMEAIAVIFMTTSLVRFEAWVISMDICAK